MLFVWLVFPVGITADPFYERGSGSHVSENYSTSTYGGGSSYPTSSYTDTVTTDSTTTAPMTMVQVQQLCPGLKAGGECSSLLEQIPGVSSGDLAPLRSFCGTFTRKFVFSFTFL